MFDLVLALSPVRPIAMKNRIPMIRIMTRRCLLSVAPLVNVAQLVNLLQEVRLAGLDPKSSSVTMSKIRSEFTYFVEISYS
jgi:hypothetical protein